MAELTESACAAIDRARPIFVNGVGTEQTAKGDRDFATAADFAVERQIRGDLARATPDIGFVGEEDGGDSTHERWWCLDPIDGTVNFAAGSPLCAISLALVEGGRPVFGVIDAPRLGARYLASEGCGATKNGRPVRFDDVGSLADAIVTFGDFAVGDHAKERNDHRLAMFSELAQTVLRIRMLGSAALDLAWLAEGTAHASITLGGNLWDVAAGQLIAQEAGAYLISSPFVGAGSTIACVPRIREPLQDVLTRFETATAIEPTT